MAAKKMNEQELDNARRIAADLAFQNYDYQDAEVEDTSGWEWESPGKQMTRVVYLVNREDEEEPSEKSSFTVNFKDNKSAEVVEAYALSSSGNYVGRPESIVKPAKTKKASSPTL